MVAPYRAQLASLLQKGGIAQPQREADWILQAVLRCSQTALLCNTASVSRMQWEECKRVASRRIQRVPLQYLLGEWEFFGLPFAVGEGVLIPRPETELLCECLLQQVGKQPAQLLDLCAGSGCITISLSLHAPQLRCTAVELSPNASGYLKKNLQRHRVSADVLQADVLDPHTPSLCPAADWILCNPPYLTRADMERLQPELKFEPKEALYGGEDGLLFYRTIAALYRKNLQPHGVLLFEVGSEQGPDVKDILLQNGYGSIQVHRDLQGIERVVGGSVL